jgi:hypothetical protein
VTAQSNAELAINTQQVQKVIRASTETSLAAEIKRFEEFIGEDLLSSDDGEAIWRNFAGERTVEEVLY